MKTPEIIQDCIQILNEMLDRTSSSVDTFLDINDDEFNTKIRLLSERRKTIKEVISILKLNFERKENGNDARD